MKAYLTFGPNKDKGYRLAFLKDDARTSYPRAFLVDDALALARVVARLNGNVAELHRMLRSWGQGSLVIHPTETQVRWLEKKR